MEKVVSTIIKVIMSMDSIHRNIENVHTRIHTHVFVFG